MALWAMTERVLHPHAWCTVSGVGGEECLRVPELPSPCPNPASPAETGERREVAFESASTSARQFGSVATHRRARLRQQAKVVKLFGPLQLMQNLVLAAAATECTFGGYLQGALNGVLAAKAMRARAGMCFRCRWPRLKY